MREKAVLLEDYGARRTFGVGLGGGEEAGVAVSNDALEPPKILGREPAVTWHVLGRK